jgi:hypothetical protein
VSVSTPVPATPAAPAAPVRGEPSSNATHGASELDAFASKVAAHLGLEKAAEAAPKAPDTGSELPETQSVSGKDGADPEAAKPAETGEEGEGDAPGSEDADASGDEKEGDEKPVQLSSLSELAEALEVEVDDLMSLALPTKVDGEEGQATLRDLLRSYQTEQHLTRKGQKLAEDRKAFDAKRGQAEQELQARIQSLDTSLALANQRLMGKYAKLDWDALRAQNPQAYQQAYIEYQQLYGELSQAAQALQQEQARYAEMQTQKYNEYVEEQRREWLSKVPEWSDNKVKTKELSDMREYMKAHGIDPSDLDRLADHRYGLVLRDAMKWHQLQAKAKDTKRELKRSGPIVKPGLKKSGASISQEKAESLRSTLKKTGKPDDLASIIKNNWSR